jgi:hypothetical protein
VGPITGHWIHAQIKVARLIVIETSQNRGVSARRSCSLLMIAYRRVVRWQGCLRDAIVRCRSVQQETQRPRRRAENQKINPPQQQNNRPPALLPVA